MKLISLLKKIRRKKPIEFDPVKLKAFMKKFENPNEILTQEEFENFDTYMKWSMWYSHGKYPRDKEKLQKI